MKLRIGMALSLLLVIPAGTVFAVSGDEIQSVVESRYRLTTNDLLGNLKEPGTILIVQKQGLKADRPFRLFNPNLVVNRQVAAVGGGNLALRGNFDGYLKAGDRLYLYGVRTGENYVELELFTAKSFSVSGSGSRGPVPLQANTRFRYDGGLAAVSAGQVMADIDAWFGPGDSATAGAGPMGGTLTQSGAKEKPAGTIRLGQSETEVTAILGQPDKKILLGAKSVFVYGNLKVVFIDGRVMDAE